MAKTFLSLSDQRELLAHRGLLLLSGAETERLLYDTNYYRLSGYARQFQEEPRRALNRFDEGSSLARLCELMARDNELRVLLLEALTLVETTIRSRFAYEAGRAHGHAAFYLDRAHYLGITKDLDRHIAKIESELSRPKLRTVSRYRKQNDLSEVPIWVAIELVSYGALARMIQYFADPTAARATAASLSLGWSGFQSTIHAFAVLRNICAHHGQLWHRRLDITAPTLKKDKRYEPRHSNHSAYGTVIALKRYVSAIDARNAFPTRVDALLAADPEYAAGIFDPDPK